MTLQFKQNYTQLPSHFYADVTAEQMQNPKLVHVNRALQTEIGLKQTDAEILTWLSGEAGLPNAQPIAQKYTGHQFGYYNPDLGDGRGHLLGQFFNHNTQSWLDFHLKGAGQTPYSRRGDGRAVLRSTLREYLASEALFGLGVPTTRALAVATSDDRVIREGLEPRGNLLRISPSHIRFGHFEWAFTQGKPSFDALLNYVLQHHYAHLLPAENPAQALLTEVCQRTAYLIASWQSVGFNHGVMNTDNMSILGETFDFGPYAFMDDFNLGNICNHSDERGRYAYNEQPKIGLWNCQVLGQSFQHHLSQAVIENAMDEYVKTYNQVYLQKMMAKLGCETEREGDRDLVHDLFILLDTQQVDFSLFFRRLARLNETDENTLWALMPQPQLFKDWMGRYTERLKDETQVKKRLLAHNPVVYLRNYIAQEIIEQVEKGDYEILDFWLPKLQNPFEEDATLEAYQYPPNQAQKSMILSCSS